MSEVDQRTLILCSGPVSKSVPRDVVLRESVPLNPSIGFVDAQLFFADNDIRQKNLSSAADRINQDIVSYG